MNLNVLDAYGCAPTLFPATLCRVLACQPWLDLGWTSSLQPSTKHGQNMKSEREREEGGRRREEGGRRREEGEGKREYLHTLVHCVHICISSFIQRLLSRVEATERGKGQ